MNVLLQRYIMKNFILFLKTKSFFKKIISIFVLFCFTSLQLLPSGWADVTQPVDQQKTPVPEKEVTKPAANQTDELPPTSIDFLNNNSPLTPVVIPAKAGIHQLQPDTSNYDFEAYSFEQALELIRPDFAAAIPIKSLSSEELDQLKKSDVEVALVTIKGKKFLLTSGQINEIRTTREVSELLKEASFVAHTHPDEAESDGPSALDLAVATDQIECLVTQKDIFAFNHRGVQRTGITNDEFLNLWEKAGQSETVDEHEARAWANRFIVAMDRLNQNQKLLDVEAFRASGTVLPDSTLTSASLSNFFGSPWALILSGSSANTNILQQSSSQLQINYDVTAAGSKSGAVVSFDNPTTTSVEVTDLSIFTQFIVGASGPAGSKIRFEIEDSLGAKSDVDLINLTSAVQYYKIPKILFTGLDWTKVKKLTYWLDSTFTSQLIGTITLQIKTLTFSTTPLTNLPNAPYLAVSTGSSTATQVIEQNSTQFQLNYDVTAAGSSSGASIVLDIPWTTAVEYGNLSTLSSFTFGLSGPAGAKVKLEFEDYLGAKSFMIISGLTTALQYITVSRDAFTGLDWTKIKQVSIKVDSTLVPTPTGLITIQAKTLTFSTTVLTNLPNSPYAALSTGSSKNSTVTHLSSAQVNLNYDLTTAGSSAGASIVLDNPATIPIEYGNLSALNDLTFGLWAPAGGKVRLEVEDSLGVKSSVILSGLTAGIQYFTVSKSAFSGLDWTKIKQVTFKVDSTLVSPLTGTISIQAKTLTFSTTLLTNLPASPQVGILEGSTLPTTVAQNSDSSFALNFSLTGAGTKSGAVINFDNPTTTTVETQNLSTNSQFVFSAYGVTNGKLKVEMEDVTGAKAAYVMTGLYTGLQYFVLAKELFTGVDLTKVKRIIFSVDPTLTTLTSGSLTIGAKTLFYSTTQLLTLPAKPNPVVTEGSFATTYLTSSSTTQMKLNYDVTAAGSFSGMSFSFDDLATTTVEIQNLSAVDPLVFGLQTGTSAQTKIKVEFEDAQGAKSSQLLPINTVSNYLIIQKSLFTGLDWTKIKRINFIVDKTMITSSTGYKSYALVSANNFLYTPTVVSSTSYTSASVTTLPFTPSLYMQAGSSSGTTLSETMGQLNLGYDLTQPATSSGARISWDKPSTTLIESTNLSALTTLIVGLSGPANTVRLELVDLYGARSSVLLTDIAATMKYFGVAMSLFTGIDKTKIKSIEIKIDPVVANNSLKTGTLSVQVKGLTPPMLSAPVVNAVTSPTSQSTQKLTGTKGLGTGIVVNGVMVVRPTDSTTWEYDVNLTVEGENIFQVQETNGAGVLGPFTEVRITKDTVSRPVEATKFTDLTVGTAKLELKLNSPGAVGWSYSLDGGVFSAPVAFSSSKIISVSEAEGRRTIDAKFYDASANVSQTYHEEFNLEAVRTAVNLVPSASTESLDRLVEKGMLRTDERGNLLALYDRDLLLEQTGFSSSTLTIAPQTHGAALPSITAEFSVTNVAPAVLFETGFQIPDQFLKGTVIKGTAQLVIEDGFFKLKVKRPHEEVIDGAAFLVDREEVLISKRLPAIGKRYELQFHFTLAGLEVYLDSDHRLIASEPLFVLAGVQADPYLNVSTGGTISLRAIRMYGNTKKILTSDNQIHEFAYTMDVSGKLTQVLETVKWLRFSDAGLAPVLYTLKQNYDPLGRLTSLTNRNGEVTNFTYDVNRRISSRTETVTGRVLNFTYAGTGGNLFVTKTLQYTDDFGNIINSVAQEDFDPSGRRTRLQTPDGTTLNFAYAAAVTASVAKGAYSYTVLFTPDSRGRLISSTDRRGVKETRTYTFRIDGSEKIDIQHEIPSGAATPYLSSEYVIRDLEGRLLETKDANGRIETDQYDSDGDPTQFTDGWGRVTAWTYVKDMFRQILRVTQTVSYTDDFSNVINSTSSKEYDRYGNLTSEVGADGKARKHVYEFHGYNRMLKSRTTYFYQGISSLDQLASTHLATPSLFTVKTQWNELGDRVLENTADEKTINMTLERDLLGRLKKRTAVTNWTAEDGRAISITGIQEWDNQGNLIREVLENGDELLHTYGAYGSRKRTVQKITFGANLYTTTIDFSETRNSQGLLQSQNESVASVDSFTNSFTEKGIRTFNEFGEETKSIDRSGKGRVTVLSRFSNGDVQEIKVYEYDGVNDLAALDAAHLALPKLIERTKFDSLGRTIETENKNGLLTTFTRTFHPAGQVKTETRNVQIPGSAAKIFVDEFNSEGQLISSTDDQNIVTTYTYGTKGELKNQVETGAAPHSVQTSHTALRYASGIDKVLTQTKIGIDRFGRQVDLESIQEFSSRGELAYAIDEAGVGQVILRERDQRDRIRKLTTYELKDGEGFLAYAKANLGASASLTHLSLDLLKSWFSLLSTNPTVAAQFAPQISVQEWDALGNQITNDQKQERLEKTILTNTLGGPSEIKNQTYFSLGTNGPIIRTPIEAKAFVSVDDLPKITVAGTPMNLSALTGAGIALVILPGASLAGAMTKTYTTSQISTLTADLNARAAGDLVILVTRGDTGKNFNEALFTALEAFGSAKVRGAIGGGAFSFIGVKGNAHAQAIEDYQERPGDTAQAINFRATREVYDFRGSLTHYEDGLGNILDYTRGFDGEALTLTETRQQDSWQKITTYQKIKDAMGHVLSTQESIVETTPETFDDPESFPRNWEISNAGGTYPIQTGRLTVDPLTGRWMSSIYPQAADNHELTGDLKLEVNQNAEIGFWLRYISTSQYLGLRLMKDRIRLILHENQNETILNEVLLASQLLANTNYTFAAKMTGSRILFTLNGSTVFDYTIPTTTIIPSSGILALNLEKGKASFDNLTAIRRLIKGRTFGGAEILTQRTDQAGVMTSFNSDGDIVRVDDPAGSTVKIYELEKYASGSLKRKKETVSVTAKNVEGLNVTTTLSTESQYDVNGHLIRFIDTAGTETLYTYTTAGETASTIFPDGQKINYSYASNTSSGSRTMTEIHYQAKKNPDSSFIRDTSGNLIYDETSRVVKTHNKDGDLIFLSEYLTGDATREEIDFTYQYWPGAERKLKRKDATHRFIDISTGSEALRYATYEERDQDGRILKSKDDQGIEKEYQYRELVRTGQDNLKRIATIREIRNGDVTMHYYFYRSTDSYSTLQYVPPQYWDLDQDETGDEANDLDFVIEVRDRGTADKSDDEIQVFQYSGKVENERIEKRILYQLGGMTNPDKESSYVYHYDGALDQIVNYQYDYLYNPTTGLLDRQPKRLESTTTYKADATGSPRIDKVTDAFTIKNYFYTSTGRLDRVEETNGTFPNRVTTNKYNSVGDIISVTDFYGRMTYYEYVKNASGKNMALFETNNQDQGRIFRMFADDGELALEMDRNGRITLFDSKPHPSQFGKTITETQYFLKDSSDWLTPWFLGAPGTYNSVMSTLDRNGNGKIEDSDLGTLFSTSGLPAGTTLSRDKTYKVFNRDGDLVLSLSPEGLLSGYDYAKDIFEAKRQTQWMFYKADPTLGYVRINLDGFDASISAAWTLLGEKLLKSGGRDYQELTFSERAVADTNRQAAWSEFLIGLAKISLATDLDVVKTVRRHNSNGELIEEIEPTGLSRQTIYSRDTFGVPQSSYATNSKDGAVIYQEFNHDGEVVRQRFTSGLVKEFTYTKDALGNTSRVTERTLYPHDPLGQGSLETRDLNLAGETVKMTDRNAVITDLTTHEDQTGAKEILRTSHFTDTFGNSINFTELERLDRYGNTVYRQDRNGRMTTITYKYDALGHISESVETTSYTTPDGQAISYQENFRFNQDGQQTYIKDKNGREVTFEYVKDAYGNTAEIREREVLVSGIVALTVRKLSPLGDLLSITDKNGFTVAYSYDKDALGNVTATYESVKLRYDFSGDRQVDDRDLSLLMAAYGALDSANIQKFDLTGNSVIDEEDAKVLTQSREYGTREVAIKRQLSVFGDLLTLTDRNGRKLFYTYTKDALGNVTRSVETTDQFQGSTTRVFNPDGQVSQMNDQNGNAVRYSYTLDAKGNVIATREDQELAASLLDSKTEQFDSLGRQTYFKQGAKIVTTTYNPDGNYVQQEFDANGLVRETRVNSLSQKTYEKLRSGVGGNLALGMPLTTSESLDTTNVPARLVDGVHNRTQPWLSKNKTDGISDSEFVRLDLGSPKTISEIRVDTGRPEDPYFVRSFDVSVSADNITWKKVAAMTNVNYEGIVSVTFPDEVARYVKVHNFQSWQNDGTFQNVGLNEIEVFGPGWSEQNYAYSTDASSNVTMTVSDSSGGFIRQEIKDSLGRVTYTKQKTIETANGGFGNGITVNGDAHIDTSSSKFGGASAVFDGAGDSLSVPDSTDFDFGTGDFTIDTWVNFSDAVWFNGVISKYMSGTGWIFTVNTSSGDMVLYDSGSSSVSARSSFSVNAWYHLAVVRSGSVIKFFKDGVQQEGDKTIPVGRTYNGASTPLKVGIYDTASGPFKGRMDEVRISKGTARWASNFSPPTQEYVSDSFTKLLLHMNGNKVDEQWTSYSTASGNTTATTTDSIGILKQETRDNLGRITYLKTRNAGTANVFTEEWTTYTVDSKGNTVATVWNSATLRDSTNMIRQSEEFRDIDGKLIRTDQHVKQNGQDVIVLMGDRQDGITPEDLTSALPIASAASSSAGSMPQAFDGKFDGSYAHAAIGGSIMFTLADTTVIGRVDSYFHRTQGIGYQIQASLDGINWYTVLDKSNAYYKGLQSDVFSPVKAKYLRIQATKSETALSEFNLEEAVIYPPKGWPVTSTVSRTFNIQGDLLTETQKGGRSESYAYEKDSLDNVIKVTETHYKADSSFDYVTSRYFEQEILAGYAVRSITPVGDTHIDTSSSKFGGASAVFDGVGDALSVPNSSDFDFGTGDFTIDTWVNFSDAAWFNGVISKYLSGTGWIFTINTSSGDMILYDSGSSSVIVKSSFSINTWYHVAVVRSGSAIKFFKDGIQQGADQIIPASRSYNGAADVLKVGAYDTGNSGAFKGRIDELRVSKGIARWTSNFPPPTSEYTYDVNTKLLLHMNGANGSTNFQDAPITTRACLPKECSQTASIDRDGKLTRYSYEYDAAGNQIGTYQLTQRGGAAVPAGGLGFDLKTEFSGEVRDTFGRVVKQISDSGQITYFSYELDSFGNIKKTYVRDSAAETVNVQKNLLLSQLNPVISGDSWTNLQTQVTTNTNNLFDGNSATDASVAVTSGVEKPLEFNFSGIPTTMAVGDVHVDTARSVFGGASAFFDGAGDYISSPDTSDFDFGSGDFTIDTWVNFNSVGFFGVGSKYINPNGWIFTINTSSGDMTMYDSGGSQRYVTASPFNLNTWYHIAVVRAGSQLSFYKGGALQGTVQAAAAAYNGSGPTLKIGAYDNSISGAFSGWMDELRISKGLARWTSSFTPSTQEYIPDSNTKLLLHMNGLNGSKNFPPDTLIPAKKVDISRVRFLTNADANLGYRIETTQDGINWTTVVNQSTGGLKAEWHDFSVSSPNAFIGDPMLLMGVQKIRIVPVGTGTFKISEIQIFEQPHAEQNYQIVREYDGRGNIKSEKNILRILWEQWPELRAYFPDPEKKGLWGRWKGKTILDWAREEGWLMDPRLHNYIPQLDFVTPELKDAFDSRRELQRRFTDEAGLINWAVTTGSLTDSRLDAYKSGRTQDSTVAIGLMAALPPGAIETPRYGPTAQEWQPVYFDQVGTNYPSVIDGTIATGDTLTWGATEAPKSFVVKLDSLRQIGMSRFKTNGDGTTGFSYSIEASKDGLNWFTVVDKTSGRYDGWQEDYFPPVQVLYLRITGDRDTSEGRSLSIYEIEAYSVAAPGGVAGGGETASPIPIAIDRWNAAGSPIQGDNALFLVWKANPSLQKIFTSLTAASTLSGRWNGKTLLDWAKTEGYKHYLNLQSYAPVGTTDILPGLRQVFDDGTAVPAGGLRSLQDQFRKNGTKDSDLIQYARSRGYREDSRLVHYGPYKSSDELPRSSTFETKFDAYGNQSWVTVKEEQGTRTRRRFNQEGRVVEEKDELMLLWEQTPELYNNASLTTSTALRNWAESTGSRDLRYGRALTDYSAYTIGGALKEKPARTLFEYTFSPGGYLSEMKQSFLCLEGGDGCFSTGDDTKWTKSVYDQDGNEIEQTLTQGDHQAILPWTLFKDKSGRLIRRTRAAKDVTTGSVIYQYPALNEFLAIDLPSVGPVALGSFIANFLFTNGRLPTADELTEEQKFISEKGQFASRARLSETTQSFSSVTVRGQLDPLLVQNYGMTSAETTQAMSRAAQISTDRSAIKTGEDSLENKYLGTLVQKAFRRLLGRDASETIQAPDTELNLMITKLKTLNSESAFEQYLTGEHNKDTSGLSEHNRRTNEIQSDITNVTGALQIYFGLINGTLDPKFLALLKILKSDPAFQMKELTQSQLDQIKQKLLSLTTEDIHFGQSAIYSVYELLKLKLPASSLPTLAALTTLALFSDILTGVISPEFEGNLQFSAYTLKALSEIYSVKTIGLKLSWSDLVKIVQSGYSVIANIEERHFVLVTAITGSCAAPTDSCTVTFLENGYTRTKTAAEFNAQWFGVALVLDSALQDASLTPLYLNTKILKSNELLKVKGAGWFKKLFRKIAKFFRQVFQAVARVLQKIQATLQKFFATGFGRVVGFIFGGPIIMAALNVALNTSLYLAQGDFKGLLKYWGNQLLQIGIMVVVAVLAPYILGPLMGFMGGLLQGLGSGLIQFGAQYFSGAVSSFIQSAGAFLARSGLRLAQAGTSLIAKSNQFLKDLKTNGFSKIQSLFKPGALDDFKNQLNPLTTYKSLLPDGVRLISRDGISSLLANLTEQASVQIAQAQLDQTLDKTKMNSFLKSLISTASSAAIGAFQEALHPAISRASQTIVNGIGTVAQATKGFFSSLTQTIQGLKTPPINTSSVLQGKNGYSSLGNFTFGGGIAYAQDNTGTPTTLFKDQNPNPFGLEKLSYDNIFRADTDEGRYNYLRVDPTGRNTPKVENIGNLPDGIRLASTPNQQPLNQSLDFGKLTQDLFFKGNPVGIGERFSKLPITKQVTARTVDFLRSPNGKYLLSETERQSGNLVTVLTLASLIQPQFAPITIPGVIAFTAIQSAAGSINIGLNSKRPLFDTSFSILKYSLSERINPFAAPFVETYLDETLSSADREFIVDEAYLLDQDRKKYRVLL